MSKICSEALISRSNRLRSRTTPHQDNSQTIYIGHDEWFWWGIVLMRIVLVGNTVKPRLETHMHKVMILFEVFLKSIDLILQQNIFQRHYSYYI